MATKGFKGATRGIGETPLNGLPIKTTEQLTAFAPPHTQKSYPYKRSKGDPTPASDSLASAPVSMTPKRQVKASGETAAVSDDDPSRPLWDGYESTHVGLDLKGREVWRPTRRSRIVRLPLMPKAR